MLAKDLIDRLERLGLLDQEIIEALREQLQQSGARVTPEAVAKLLVDNGQLTSFQATKLIGELRSDQYDEPSSDGDLAEIDDAVAVEVLDDEPMQAVAVAAEPVVVEAEPVAAAVAEPMGVPGDRPRPQRARPVREEKSVWDSFKIYGYLGIIGLLLLSGFALYYVLTREDAEERFARADELYNQQNYEAAQEAYVKFLEDFGDENQYSSSARTKVTMTELYKAAQFKQEPGRAVDVAKEKLPLVAEEEGMNDERGNLAQLLVDIADNITSAADRAKETTRKRELLEELKEHYTLIDDPLYMPSSMRVTLGAQLKNVDETRARVQRDINRNVRLDASESAMKASLDRKATKEAYDERSNLLQDFPELYDEERLQILIRSASDIQQTLVESSTKLPSVRPGTDEESQVPTVVLTTLAGRAAPELTAQTLYLRAGGSVMGFDGETGSLKWRKFVGYADNLPPVRIDGDTGVLLSDNQTNAVLRVSGDDGSSVWVAEIAEPFLEPISERDGVFITTPSGRLNLLDVETGDAKWVTQYPQGLDAGPGVDRANAKLYQAGDHSNLYILGTRDGKCSESFYLGHDEGTVVVPPVPLLGHVFVIENATPSYARVHVLRVDDEGNNLRIAQRPFGLDGNVRVKPVIEGRQLIVLTDRGEVKVFDIEPTAENEQVTMSAHLPPFYDTPTETQMVVGRSAMWITGSRLGRYDLQLSSGRIVRKWSLHELDNFLGEPFLKDDVLVHARRLRDSAAIRVTAANPKTGDEIWRTDVGVPIASLQRSPDGQAFHAITTQAALFELDRESLQTGTTKPPLEDPGAASVGIRYGDPVGLGDGKLAMLDVSGGQKLLMYDPSRPREKVREVTMQLPTGKPSGGIVASAGGVFIPLTSGRAVLVNPVTGAAGATPFQPSSDPSQEVSWTRPVTVPDDPDQVVIGDSRGRLYRLRVGPQIRELSSEDLQKVLLGPATRVGDHYIASTGGPASDSLVGFQMANLEQVFSNEIGGRIAHGPLAVDEEHGMYVDAGGDLVVFAADGTEKFRVGVAGSEPVGPPTIDSGRMTFCMRDGTMISIDQATGEVVGKFDLGQPISAPPLSIGTKLLIPGGEGVVYVVDRP